jgi:hypothetical protein
MHHLPAFFFANLTGNAELTFMLAVVLCLAIPIIAIVLYYHSQHQREKLWHETARLALEKGQPIPSLPSSDDEMKCEPPPGANPDERWRWNRERRRQKDVRGGLVLLALGLALFFSHWHGHFLDGDGSIGAYVLTGLGLAMLINAFLQSPGRPPGNDFRGPPPRA